jgi:hypothetical protein
MFTFVNLADLNDNLADSCINLADNRVILAEIMFIAD